MDDWVVLYQVDELSLCGKADLKWTNPRHVFLPLKPYAVLE